MILILTSLVLQILATAVGDPKIVRVDRVSIFTEDLIANEFPAYSTTAVKNSKALAPSASFSVLMECGDTVPAKDCALAKQALLNCGERIASMLTVNSQIKIAAKYHAFCPSTNPNCDIGRRLGSAISASSFPVDDATGQALMYPQALLKQLKTDKILQYSNADIIAEFNSDQPFFFREPGQDFPNANQYDFEFVVIDFNKATHEITHGLGFKTGNVDFKSVFSRPLAYAAPFVAGVADKNQILYKSLQPIDVFDAFIFGSGLSMKELGRTLNRFSTIPGPIGTFLNKFEKSGDAMWAAQQIYTMMSNPITFKISKGVDVPLYSPTTLEQGSTSSHTVSDSINTPDFLMVPSLTNGASLDNSLMRFNTTNVYGPNTIAVMQTLGWPTYERPIPVSVGITVKYSEQPTKSEALSVYISPINNFLGYVFLVYFS